MLVPALLFNPAPGKPPVSWVVMSVLSGVALVAGAVPAWRAARVSPVTALCSQG